MGLGLHDSFTPIAIADIICVFVGSFTTLYRLYIRRSRLWWDDGCAFVAMVFFILQLGVYFAHYVNPDALSHFNKVVTYYIIPVCFYFVIWSARLSILFSLLRIEPNPYRQRRIVIITVFFFIAIPLLLVQLFITCEREPDWKNTRTPQCSLGKKIAITQLVTDVVADTILLLTPLRLFMTIQDKSTRRRLIVIFSTCIATSIVSLVHAAYILLGKGTQVLLSAIVENGVSLTVCSLPVVLTSILRFHNSTSHPSTSVPKTRWASTLRFTRSTTIRHDTVVSGTFQSNSSTNAPALRRFSWDGRPHSLTEFDDLEDVTSLARVQRDEPPPSVDTHSHKDASETHAPAVAVP